MELVKKYEIMLETSRLYSTYSPLCCKVANELSISVHYKKEDYNNFILYYEFKVNVNRGDHPYIKNTVFCEDHINILLEHCSKKDILFDTKKLHHKIKPYSFSIKKTTSATAQVFASKKQAKEAYRKYIYYCLINGLDFETVNKRIIKKYDRYLYNLLR